MTSHSARTCIRFWLLAWVGLGFISRAPAAVPKPAEWTAVNSAKGPISPGVKFQVVLTAKIRPGWHIYAMQVPDNGPLPTEIGLATDDPLELLTVDSRMR